MTGRPTLFATRLPALLSGLLFACAALAYPIDAGDESGIRRLEGFVLAQQTPGAARLAPGQLWPAEQIRLRLLHYDGPDFDALPEDPLLAEFLASALRRRDPSYAMVIVDYSDPQSIRWAGLRPDLMQNPGSVGKLLCMAAVFHALAEAFPDIEDRVRILREAESRAGNWVSNEIHKVPKWDDASRRNWYS
ncbi:MAG: hypothetical protein R3288_02370, partial [Woeseiaceae bacterium]|nr:hypothetical protein [Woeseiaceae bacterium]